jgi:N-acetylglucosamine-6-phosphate deacetylase
MNAESGFVDLQINGFAGVDFNADHVSSEQMHACCARLKEEGVAGVLATVITDDVQSMTRRLRRIVELREGDDIVRDVVWGLHIEGPFINPTPGYVGAHPAPRVRLANWEDMQRLLDAGGGLTRIVTLAPECDPDLRVTRKLADAGLTVSAGHCDPSLDQLKRGIDSGLSMFTHLGNGCPMHMHRHDNIIQRVLHLSDRLWISFIADGAHIDFPALANYLRLAGEGRAVIVSDAISAAGLGPGTYTLGPQSVVIGDDLVPRAPDRSHFFGSACTMSRMADNLRRCLGLEESFVTAVMRRNPRSILGC